MDIEKLTGQYLFKRLGDYLILYGRDFRIYKIDGSLVAQKAWRNVTCIVPLSDSSILCLHTLQKAYIAVSITDGEELWRIQYTWKKIFLTPDITINHSKTCVYQYAYKPDRNDLQFVVVIDVVAQSAELLLLNRGLRSIADIICDCDDTPCLLETHNENIGGETVSLNGIRLLFQDPLDIGEYPGSAYYYKYKWTTAPIAGGNRFFDGTDVILTWNAQLYFPKTGEYRALVKDGELNVHYVLINKSADGRYLQMHEQHVANGRDVVIDMQEQKIVAQYNAICPGCIVGDEYWSTSKEGFRRRPFPLIEEYIPHFVAFEDVLRMTDD